MNVKKIKLYAFTMVNLFILASCSSDAIKESEINNEEHQMSAFSTTNGMGVQSMYINNGHSSPCQNNILVFQSPEHYGEVLDYLEHIMEVHDDNFVNSYPNLDWDDLDDMEDAVNFNEFEPLEIFENDLGFCSLRKKVWNLEQQWLASQGTEIDYTNNPSETMSFEIDDWEEMTLYNPQGEIIIGRTFYKLVNGGQGHVEVDINNPNLEAIIAIVEANNGEVGATEIREIETLDGAVEEYYDNTGVACLQNHRDSQTIAVSSNRRIRAKNSMNIGPVHYTLKAKTISHKLKNGSWKRRRANISAGFEGDISSPRKSSCDDVEFYDGRRSISKKRQRKYADRKLRVSNQYNYKWKFNPLTHEFKSWHHILGNVIYLDITL